MSGAMADFLKGLISNDFLNCLICNNRLNSTDRIPSTLLCGHTLCMACLKLLSRPATITDKTYDPNHETLLEEGRSVTVYTCPNCKQNTVRDKTHSIKPNYQLMEILDRLDTPRPAPVINPNDKAIQYPLADPGLASKVILSFLP